MATLLNRRSGGGDGHAGPPREPQLPRHWPEQLPFRKRPKPYSRAITWTPGSPGVRPDRKRPYELFVSQSVLRQVRGHLITARSGEPYGFLLGQVVYCPWSDAPYIVIDAVRRESQNLPPANDMDRFRHAWVAATRDARHRHGEVVGWYHRHGVLGLRMSEWDLHLQEEFFPEAWHCALIVASTSKGIIGGFIQRSPRARLFRKGLAPFHELVDLDAKLVDGRKPSFVDWENYGAGEPVSVLKARWPAPRTRLERWKAPDHTSEGEPPTTDAEGAAAPRPSAGSRGLRGRTWHKPSAPRKEKESGPGPADGTRFSEEEFAGAVGPAGSGTRQRDVDEATPEPDAATTPGAKARGSGADDAEEAGVPPEAGGESPAPPADAEAAGAEAEEETPAPRKRAGSGGKGGKRADAAATGATDETADAAAAGDGAPAVDAATEAEAAVAGAWYSSEFAEAVWGELPFGLEASEPSTGDEEGALAPTGRRRPSGSGRGADATDEARTRAGTSETGPRFEFVPPFESEPIEEIDEDRSSLAWVLSLIGETLARARAESERSAEAGAEDQPGATQEGAAEPDTGDGPRESGDTPGAEPADTPAASDAPAIVPDPSARPGREPTRRRPPLATPASGRHRKTFVSASQNPDDDPEAEIPVVLFRDPERWRPSPGLIRIAAVVAVLVLGALAIRAIGDRGPAIPPPAPAAQPPSITDGSRPTQEFVDLADAYLTGLQSYRERIVQHGLGQVDCGRLTEDFRTVVRSHRTLARYVAANPSMADRFGSLDAEMSSARQRFEASGCPVPPELAPQASPADAAGRSTTAS